MWPFGKTKAACVRVMPPVLLRRRALNLLRQDTSVKAEVDIQRRKVGRNLAYMEQVLSLA